MMRSSTVLARPFIATLDRRTTFAASSQSVGTALGLRSLTSSLPVFGGQKLLKKPQQSTQLTLKQFDKLIEKDLKKRIVQRLKQTNQAKPQINSTSLTQPLKSHSVAPQKNLFKYQNSLPRLPIPSLEETCSKYLASVRPLLSETEFGTTTAVVNDFMTGFGRTLQQRLIEHDKLKPNSWLIDWWNSLAYMAYRDPVVVNVSYYYSFVDDPNRMGQPALRAAEIATAAMEFRRLIVTEELQPDMVRGTPLCSNQYRYLFNSTRIPQIPEDITRLSDPTKHNHIIVVRKNQFFNVELVVNGKQLSTDEIKEQIEAIYNTADQFEDVPPVGVLTTLDRDTWTHARQELLSFSKKNQLSLDKIETAAFVICLDDSKPTTLEERAMGCWVGDGKNRFFDKSLQFIVFDNAAAGFNGEHSMVDGSPTLRLCDWLLGSLAKGIINHGRPTGIKHTAPSKLDFDVSDNIKSFILKAAEKFQTLVDGEELRVLEVKGFGKDAIKELKCSPDAFVQMAIQLAYYKVYGESVATYEAAQTKKFQWGRTETGRSLSSESLRFVQVMQDPGVGLERKAKLGRRAMKAQSQYLAEACDGKGVDRHLLGLRLVQTEKEKQQGLGGLFLDPAYSKSTHWKLSTSQISSEWFNGLGFGQVVNDGYGIGYQIKGNNLMFTVVSKKEGMQNQKMVQALEESIAELKKVFKQVE
ncbi:Carnitine O-acetyltransferase mitochondrial [Rhizoclosmatium sp. JEL0117]|nr:Carnitine O-acetyltransferase mitochondrial [Rhizoclosmatium sp. JEL0117]